MRGESEAWGGTHDDDGEQPGEQPGERRGGRPGRPYDAGGAAGGAGVDVGAVVTQLLDIAADPERPMPYRHMAAAEARDLRAGCVNPAQAADLAQAWAHATMDPEEEAQTRRAVPSFWTTPVLPPSAEVRRTHRRHVLRRQLAAASGAAGLSVVSICAWWMIFH